MQLNFARYRRQLKGFKKTTANTQVIGFSDSDTYEIVLAKASKALGITCERDLLQLICSGGIVLNAPIGTKPWSLGEFIKHNGGYQNRGKKVWGIDIPIGYDEAGSLDKYVCLNTLVLSRLLSYCSMVLDLHCQQFLCQSIHRQVK